ncbi:hypothetical protein B296_00004923 [Ensete ventricosum]|uniref:Uncharacterized protein n=1 Tax=Ensete ventricosum TaxID=4639 RepID=A0A427B599_ENSVE|nr:hypothetical protein B296_00004923 [Ensete ventricosum]
MMLGTQATRDPPSSAKRILFNLHTKVEVSPWLGIASEYMDAQGSSLAPEGCASSSGHRMVSGTRARM